MTDGQYTETIRIKAREIQAGDTLNGWDGYEVVRFESHPDGIQGRIHLRDMTPSTAPYCWTPTMADEIVQVTR